MCYSTISEYVEETACGLESLILCNWVCRERTEVACNTINDCGDWYDESNCPGQSVSCDFETSETCGYEIQQTDYQWVYNSGNTSIPGTGPQHDHTYQNESGTGQAILVIIYRKVTLLFSYFIVLRRLIFSLTIKS